MPFDLALFQFKALQKSKKKVRLVSQCEDATLFLLSDELNNGGGGAIKMPLEHHHL